MSDTTDRGAASAVGVGIDDVSVGQALPPIRLPFPLTSVVATALATRDYQPVHHDLERARHLGSDSVFTNTHTAAGCLERVVMEWAGPNAFLKSLKLRLGVPNHAGDELLLSGTVAAVDVAERLVTVDVVGRNGRGNHVTGQVTVRLLEATHG